jgi:hypothetical protein
MNNNKQRIDIEFKSHPARFRMNPTRVTCGFIFEFIEVYHSEG